MSEPTIICPNCKTEIKLTESLAAPWLRAARERYEKEFSEKAIELSKRESAIRSQRAELVNAVESIEQQVSAKLKAERERIAIEEAKKASLLFSNDLENKEREVAELLAVLQERESKLAEAQKAQADLLRKQRALDDATREMELTIEKRVQESLDAIRHKAKQEAEDLLKLKVLEKEQQITSMQRQIEELKRKAEQGSQQLQGEVQEIELERLLREKFPLDIIEPVPKGEFGGYVLQRVRGNLDQSYGTILWEVKRTKNWSDGWLAKLRDDQRAAKADIALIVSHAIPKGVEAFDFIEGVWITEPRCALPVAIALRQSLIEIATARAVTTGQQTKMELVYQYLTGPLFRQRVEAIVEKFSDMQVDLAKERRTMTRLLAKREAQIRGVIESTVGMYGDLQGIAGKALQEIDGLDMKRIDSPRAGTDGIDPGDTPI